MTGDVEALVARVGSLPDAPLAMPKQRLEAPATRLGGFVARLTGRASVASTDVQGGGR